MSLLRTRGLADSGKVGMVELFFDLVFVFAVTQLSHTLLKDLSLGAALQVGMLFFTTWWVWIYTAWVTNALDPDRKPVRIALFVLMVVGLMMSISIPQAFGDKGWLFAGAVVAQQVGRSLFARWAAGDNASLRRNFTRIAAWTATSAVFWLLGAAADPSQRAAIWAVAIAIELLGPPLYFWTPLLGRSTSADWNVEGSHMAERSALFVIIALGESLLVTGATFAELPFSVPGTAIFLLAVLGTVLMWWLYFDQGAEDGHHHLLHAKDPGRHARNTYTYLHVPLVAGIIVNAVGDELVQAHPDHADPAAMTVIVGGPLLFLCGTMLFKWVNRRRKWPPLSHMAGVLLLAVLALLAVPLHLTPVAAAAGTTATLLLVAVWETCVLRLP
jgi:low temperature requirement protein LtrA